MMVKMMKYSGTFVGRSIVLALVVAPLVLCFQTPDKLPGKVQLSRIETAEPMTMTGVQEGLFGPSSKPHPLRWLVDRANEREYWHNPTIHTLGNIGFLGALHAAMVPISTKLIDVFANDGVDVRKEVAEELAHQVQSSEARVVDLCCGVGISTRALRAAFPDADAVVGVDTSSEMISMAQFLDEHLSVVRPAASKFFAKTSSKESVKLRTKFKQVNAEYTQLPDGTFDLVTVMYAFHEIPKRGRDRILSESRRLLRKGGTLAVIDITSDFVAPPSMLAGEPYVLEYQENIHSQLEAFRGFGSVSYRPIVDQQVGMWVLTKS